MPEKYVLQYTYSYLYSRHRFNRIYTKTTLVRNCQFCNENLRKWMKLRWIFKVYCGQVQGFFFWWWNFASWWPKKKRAANCGKGLSGEQNAYWVAIFGGKTKVELAIFRSLVLVCCQYIRGFEFCTYFSLGPLAKFA